MKIKVLDDFVSNLTYSAEIFIEEKVINDQRWTPTPTKAEEVLE